MPFEERTISVRDVELNVLEGGNAEAPALVFLHGMSDVAWSLAPIARHFAERYRLLLPNLRGHGKSGRSNAYTFEHYIYDLHTVLERFDATPATIVGHSLGGQITARYAGIFPENVQRIVLLEGLGPPALPQPDADQFVRRYRERLLERFAERPPSRGMADQAEAAARLMRNNPRMLPELAALLADKATIVDGNGRLQWNFDRHAGAIFSGTNDDGARFWCKVQCPALVISGDLSYEYWGGVFAEERFTGRYAPGEMDARAAIMPRGRHVPFQHSGHMVHFDEPDRVITEIEAFLQEEA